MNNNLLIQLINGALKNDNNQVRRNAEAKLLDLRAQDPNQFITLCSNLVINGSESQFIRQSASTLLISSIRLKTATTDASCFWDTLSHGTKEQVKLNMLNALADPNPVIVRSGANVISYIAVIEIPRNEWIDLVHVLANNTTHEDVNFRRASIVTIGQICEVFHEAAVSIDTKSCEQFLAGIIMGSKENFDASIVEVSMKALRDSLSFMKPILAEEAYRNEIFKLLYSKITSQNDDRIIYEAMIEFCSACYNYLSEYLPILIEITVAHIQQRDDNTILALELYDTIGTEFIDRSHEMEGRTNTNMGGVPNFLTPIQNTILPEIMRCLLIENKADLQFPEMRNSAVKTIGTFISVGNKETIDIVAQGTATCLRSAQPCHQQASAVLLSTLCESPDKDYVLRLISDAFEPVLNLLNSNTDIVVLNTLNGLASIAQIYPQIFYNNVNIKSITDKLFEFVDSSNVGVTTAALITIKNITQTMPSECVLLTDPQLLLIRIVGYMEKYLDNHEGNNKDYLQKTVLIIMNCLMKIKDRDVLLQMVEFLMNKYYFFYEQYSLSDLDIRLSAVVGVLHTSVLALENTVPKIDLMNCLCKLVDMHINKFGIQEEGLNLISGLAISFNQAFKEKAAHYWDKLLQGLNLIQQPRTFKIALCSVGDFSRVYGEEFKDKELQILKRLLVIIHDNLDRDIKLSILVCIADIVLGLGPSAQDSIDQILRMVQLCFQAVYDFSNNRNEREYVEQLKKNLIDLYGCLSFAINGRAQRRRCSQLIEHYPMVATFIVKTCDRSQNPTIDYLKNCLYLIFDIATFYWKAGNEQYKGVIRNILDSKEVRELVAVLANFRNKEDISDLEKLIEQRYQAL